MNVTYRWEKNNFPKIRAKLPKAMRDICLEVAEHIRDEAKTIVPVRTGRLRDSIQAEIEGDDAVVYSDVDYAPIVEFGGHGRPPKPYLVPAAEVHLDDPAMYRLEEKL